jgi:hypothetical protein
MIQNTVICLELDFMKRRTIKAFLFPNRICPHSSLTFSCPGNKNIHLGVYTASDKLLRTIIHNIFPPGVHHLGWDGTDKDGNDIGNGTFTIRCLCDDIIQSQKIIKWHSKEVTA